MWHKINFYEKYGLTLSQQCVLDNPESPRKGAGSKYPEEPGAVIQQARRSNTRITFGHRPEESKEATEQGCWNQLT